MNKKGDVTLLLRISYLVFVAMIGISVYNYVDSKTDDNDFKAKIYAKDLSNTINTLQLTQAKTAKITYPLPKEFNFNLDDKYVYVSYKDEKNKQKEDYIKLNNAQIKFERKENTLILEKNNIYSII